MALICTVGDITTGHDACPPVPIVTGTPAFTVNGKPVVLVGDQGEVHGCPAHVPHTPICTKGSEIFKVNGIPVMRVGDEVNGGGCSGQVMATGDGAVDISR